MLSDHIQDKTYVLFDPNANFVEASQSMSSEEVANRNLQLRVEKDDRRWVLETDID